VVFGCYRGFAGGGALFRRQLLFLGVFLFLIADCI